MIELPYPTKVLWPNGRTRTPAYRNAEIAKHRKWAYHATLADKTRPARPMRLIATFHAKRFGPLPDKDNCVAALKSYQDGIAQACGVDDATFAEPAILFGARTRLGKVTIVLEGE